ncbi:hypothetical protein IIY68_03365 [Candidatus Saccharibacteria bacterium]|nr:hypothetical protein [Candidatus Saccharibacteria bacterium]
MTCLKIQVPLPEKYVRTGPAYFVGANNKVSFEITEFWRNFIVKEKKVLKFLPTYAIIKIVKACRQ